MTIAEERNKAKAHERNRKTLLKLLDAQSIFAVALDKFGNDQCDWSEVEKARKTRDAAWTKVLARMKDTYR